MYQLLLLQLVITHGRGSATDENWTALSWLQASAMTITTPRDPEQSSVGVVAWHSSKL